MNGPKMGDRQVTGLKREMDRWQKMHGAVKTVVI